MALKFACSLCGCHEARAGCPRCEERQPTLFSLPPPPVPDDAETTTVEALVAEAREREVPHDARLARLKNLRRAVRVGLVACAKTKRDREAPARELYKSGLFTLSLAHAEKRCDETFVVSAAHGLLELDQVVQPYDRTLRDLPKKERLAWGSRLVDAVAGRYGPLALHVLVFAGLDYLEPIEAAARRRAWVLEAPLARKTIGQRLAWLKSEATLVPHRRGQRGGA